MKTKEDSNKNGRKKRRKKINEKKKQKKKKERPNCRHNNNGPTTRTECQMHCVQWRMPRANRNASKSPLLPCIMERYAKNPLILHLLMS